MRKILVMAAIVGLGSSTAFAQRGGGAGWSLGLSGGAAGSADTIEMSGASTDSTSKGTQMGLTFGRVMGGGLYLGAAYDSMSLKDSDTDAASNATGMGVSVGYMKSGFRGVLHYIVSSTATGDNDAKFSGGSGFGADLGYTWMINNTFGVGLMVAYRNLTFTKLESAGVEVPDAKLKTVVTTPGLLLSFNF